MKRITKKRWFGPKHVGWGPAPRSSEGWIVTVVWMASLLGTLYYLHTINSLNIINIAIVIVVAAVILLSIAALTYGSNKEE